MGSHTSIFKIVTQLAIESVPVGLSVIYLAIFLTFRCPDITRLYTLSEPSVNGIPLYVLEITDNPGKHELSKYLFSFPST